MLILERITTEYNEIEDRIQLSAETAAGDHIVIWLTQRLLQRLVPVLLQWLGRNNAGSDYSEVLHAFAQTAAREELVTQSPVRPIAGHTAWLAQSIDVERTDTTVALTFVGESTGRASLTLDERFLRQWLGIIHDATQRAEWPTSMWPEWVAEESQPTNANRSLLH